MTAAQPQETYTIVVGVSATSKSPAALLWAVEQARLRQGRVVAVRAWRPPVPTSASRGTPPVVSVDVAAAEAAAREDFASDVAQSLGARHDVEVRLVRGGRRKTLVDESLGADLLVIDAPGAGTMATSPLSVQRLVRQAGCPVVVMPPPPRGHGDGRFAQATRHAARSISDAAGRAGRPGIRPAPPPPD
jgi:nucleotide-binding universal stress UspA family protein